MYDSYIKINKKFKSSINLQFDLNNLDKINEYIPTTDLCDVIKKYLLNVTGKDDNRSTILVGPHGKGKSYLLLIIIYILSIKSNSQKSKEVFNNFLSKIEKIDKELADLIIQIEREKLFLLPVIVNSNYSHDLNQIFMLSLINSFETFSLKNVNPETSFSEALKIIDKWEEDSKNGFDIFVTCLMKNGIELNELKKGLLNFDLEYYKFFEQLYECVSHGAKYNPFIGNDFVSIYSSVTRELCKKTDYKGIFIIFDEFGFFLENQTGDFSERLKNIEYLAEKCKESCIDNQMHFCCVTHKDFVLYSQENKLYNSFVKVSGRFRKIEFDRSLDENYDIICGAILKSSEYQEIVDKNSQKYQSLLDAIDNLAIFNSRKNAKAIFASSFPFNPISIYSLTQVSEKIGQNERTLFTFLSDNDVNTFKFFIANNSKGLLNIDLIYDYFENVIKNNVELFPLYSSVEVAKKVSLKTEEHRIFKAIAIIKIINDNIKFACTKENISIALGCLDNSVSRQIDLLIDNNILKQNVYDKTIDFSVLASTVISDKIKDLLETKFLNINLSKEINELKTKKYYVSNKYNFENKMTRYFSSVFITSTDYKQLSNLGYHLSGIEGDGLIVNIVKDSNLSINQIDKVLKNSERNIIVRYLDNNIDESVIKKLKINAAANYLLNHINDQNSQEYEAIRLYIDDLQNELAFYFDEIYLNAFNHSLLFDDVKLEDLIYSILSNSFNQTVIFNNELINKNELTKVSEHARNNVIDYYLFGQAEFGNTSAEGTIKRCFEKSLESSGFIIDFIKYYLIKNSGNKISVELLVNTLIDKPYGMRRGSIPLFIGYAVSQLNISQNEYVNAVLIFREDKEIDLNGSNISIVVNNPERYYFSYEKISSEQYILTKNFLNYFNCKTTGNFSTDVRCLVNAIKSYIHNLPPIFSKTTKRDNLLELNDSEIRFINLFMNRDLNNYDTLFKTLPDIFGLNYKKIVDKFSQIQDGLLNKLNDFYDKAINYLKDHFVNTDGSLYSSIDLWKNEHKYIDAIVFDDENTEIYKAINMINYDDKYSINQLSNLIVRCTLDDWNISKEEKFYEKINAFVEFVNNFDIEAGLTKDKIDLDYEDKVELSKIAETLYDNLASSIEEYGSSITKEERIKILKQLLKDAIE